MKFENGLCGKVCWLIILVYLEETKPNMSHILALFIMK